MLVPLSAKDSAYTKNAQKESISINQPIDSVHCLTPPTYTHPVTILGAEQKREQAGKKDEDLKATTKQVDLYQVYS